MLYYHGLTVMHIVCGLQYSSTFCLIAICFMFYATCYVLINYFMCQLFVSCLFSCFVRFAFHSVCSVFFSCFLCCSSSYIYNCLFAICVQYYRPLPLGGNPIAINTYHIKFPIPLLKVIPLQSRCGPEGG